MLIIQELSWTTAQEEDAPSNTKQTFKKPPEQLATKSFANQPKSGSTAALGRAPCASLPTRTVAKEDKSATVVSKTDWEGADAGIASGSAAAAAGPTRWMPLW